MSHVVAVRLSDEEWLALQSVQLRDNITMQQLMHAIVIDVLVDEGYDALRCEQSEGCSSAREAS